MAQPDRGAGVALAGYVCGLLSFCAVMLGTLNFGAQLALIFLGRSGDQPGLSSGEVLLLFIGALPVALAGLMLSAAGRHSASRRRFARAGIIFSSIALVPFLVAMLVLSLSWARCSPSCL